MERAFSEFAISKNNKFLDLIEFVRAWNAFLVFVIVLFGFFLVNQVFEVKILFLALSFTIMYFGAASLNDLADIKIDLINAPYRPIQTNRITVFQAKLIAVVSYAISLIIGLLLGLHVFVIILVTLLLSVFYSLPPLNLKDKLFLGTIDLSILTIFFPSYAGAILVQKNFFIEQNVLIVLILFTLLFLFIGLLKDLKDFFGDQINHKRTFVVEFGVKKTIIASVFGISTIFPILVYYLSKFVFDSNLFYFFSGIILLALIILTIKGLSENQQKAEKVFTESRITLMIFSITTLIFLII